MREPWADYFFKLANQISDRSTCYRRKVGAIVVTKDKRIIGTGYNGSPPDLNHCTEETCIRIKEKIPSGKQLDRCKAVHAEVNAILAAGSRINEIHHVFITNQPCTNCLKILMSLRIPFIHWINEYPDEYALMLMKEYGRIMKFAIDNGLPTVLVANFIEDKENLNKMYLDERI